MSLVIEKWKLMKLMKKIIKMIMDEYYNCLI